MLFVNAVTAFTHVTFTYTRVIGAAAKKQAQLQAKKDAAESECHVYFIFMMINYLPSLYNTHAVLLKSICRSRSQA